MNVRQAVNALLSAPAFQALEGHLRDPSLFHILKIENRERSHAACLAWLLDPRGSHGMGSTPLRTFMLLGTAAAAEAGVEGMLDATDVDGLDLNGVLATAEYVIPDGRRPDLVVLDAEDHLLMIVEYKVDAVEGVDQTASYAAWAKIQATEAGGRCRLPLLIFLCPDRSDETEPTPPFTHLKYEAYCAWLAGLSPLGETAQLLLREFGRCLAQRNDVEVPEIATLVERLRTEHAAAVDALRDATRKERECVEAVLRRHHTVFQRLGITVGSRADLGESPFVARVREALPRFLTPALWDVGGRQGSLVARFKAASELSVLGVGVRSRLEFFSTRPQNNRVRFALAVRVEPRSASDSVPNGLRDRIAANLRQHISSQLPDYLATRSTVVAFTFSLAGDGEGEPGFEEILKALEKLKGVEPVLTHWVDAQLPTLLASGIVP